eukprot:867913-Prymnesium_polylepis.1
MALTPMVGALADGQDELQRQQRRQVDEERAIEQIVERNVHRPEFEDACARDERLAAEGAQRSNERVSKAITACGVRAGRRTEVNCSTKST